MFKKIFILSLIFTLTLSAITGATKGSADVSQGSFVYNLEIVTPKGTAGVKPELAVSYNSSSGMNSIFGLSFSLSGLSSIMKCNEQLFEEKQDSSRTFNYCLDGQKLVLVDESQTYGEANTEYRTEINSNSKIVKTQKGWKVWSKDGLIREYGFTVDSKIGDSFFNLNQIKDRYGNAIDFVYQNEENRKNIKEILYSNNKIEFNYEAREDKKVVSSHGVSFNVDQRVHSIVIKTDGQQISSYVFAYDYHDNKSRMKNIQECSGGECLEPLTIEWEESRETHFGEFELKMPSGEGTHSYNYVTGSDRYGVYSALIDMNGDGLPDRVGHENSKTGVKGLHVALNTGSGFGEFKLWLKSGYGGHTYNRITGSDSNGVYSALIDMNGDGLPDRVGHHNYQTGVDGLHVALNTGSGFGEFKLWLKSGYGGHTYNYITGSNSDGVYSALIDMNGDGLPDRVGHHNYQTGVGGLHVSLNQGTHPSIKKISNGKDQEIEVEYSTLRDTEIYTPYTDATTPNIDIKASAMKVVKTLKTINGIGGFNKTHFKYEGYKTNRERGSLGFAKVITIDDSSSTRSVSNFSQTFPFVGVVESGEVYIDGNKVSDTEAVLEEKHYFTNQKIIDIESQSNIENKYNLDGSLLVTKSTINENFDRYGNIGTVHTITEKGGVSFKKITISTYENDTSNWILGRLKSAIVVHIDDNGERLERTSSFTYDSATGTLKTETIEPGSDKQLNKSYEYDQYGNKISEIVSGNGIEARETKYLYDEYGKNII